MTKLEEEAIIEYILKQSLQGIPPLKLDVQEIANRLLRDCGAKPVSKH